MSEEWLERNAVYRYKWEKGLAIFYSPIARRYVVASDNQLEAYLSDGHYADVFGMLSDYVPINRQKKVQAPADYTLLTILPNNVCNFSCSYCYSAAGRNGSYLKEEQLKAAINFFIGSKPESFSRPLTISYMGGGEPMLSWPLVKSGILYAEEQAIKRNLRLRHRIITNGSILDNSSINFLREHNIDMSVSFELLRDIQNLQRKNYDIVEKNIKHMLDSGINVQINVTITPANVGRMEETFEWLITEYNQVKNAMFEPVTGQQLFATPQEMERFYNLYTKQFVQCLRRADKEKISLTSFAYLRTIYPLERACPGELCLTADGQFTGCYCVASPRDSLFTQTRYGWIDVNNNIHFDMTRYNELKAHDVYERAECQSCKVKWNCGGGCFYQYTSYDESFRRVVCNFTRQFVEQIIYYKVEQRLPINYAYPILIKE